MSDPYVYPGTDVLRNRFDIRDSATLDRLERSLVTDRAIEGIPTGAFDLAHFRNIHKHLFQDIYAWAGEIRTVEISKGGSQFQPVRFIPIGMADVTSRLQAANYLQGADLGTFLSAASRIIGDINHVHPFREGNGRTQREYLSQLAEQAGFRFEQWRLNPDRWNEASRQANRGNYTPMENELWLSMSERSRNLEIERER